MSFASPPPLLLKRIYFYRISTLFHASHTESETSLHASVSDCIVLGSFSYFYNSQLKVYYGNNGLYDLHQ